MNEMKQRGVGLSVAVFLDAMVIRVLVLPSPMALLGRANWCPDEFSVTRRSETHQQMITRPKYRTG